MTESLFIHVGGCSINVIGIPVNQLKTSTIFEFQRVISLAERNIPLPTIDFRSWDRKRKISVRINSI